MYSYYKLKFEVVWIIKWMNVLYIFKYLSYLWFGLMFCIKMVYYNSKDCIGRKMYMECKYIVLYDILKWL